MILVTGATGFLGTHLIHELAVRGFQVRAIYRKQENIAGVWDLISWLWGDADSCKSMVEWVPGDITEPYSLHRLMDGINKVYHTAGLVSFSTGNGRQLHQINTIGTANVVNMCLEQGVEKLCHVSTIAALGQEEYPLLADENTPMNPAKPISAYARTKYLAETEVWRAIHEGLTAVIVNPSVILGPGAGRKSLGALFDRIRKGLRYFPGGASGFIDVRDVVRLMVDLTESQVSGERFILSAENRNHREIIGMVAEVLGKTPPDSEVKPALMAAVKLINGLLKPFGGIGVSYEDLKMASEKSAYSNRKICERMNATFIPIHSSVEQTVRCYILGIGKKKF